MYVVHKVLIVSLLDQRGDSSWAFGRAAVVLAFVEEVVSWKDVLWRGMEGERGLDT